MLNKRLAMGLVLAVVVCACLYDHAHGQYQQQQHQQYQQRQQHQQQWHYQQRQASVGSQGTAQDRKVKAAVEDWLPQAVVQLGEFVQSLQQADASREQIIFGPIIAVINTVLAVIRVVTYFPRLIYRLVFNFAAVFSLLFLNCRVIPTTECFGMLFGPI